MSKDKPTTTAVALAPAAARAEAATRELGQLMSDQAERALQIAHQVGYEGTLTVGVLEDEIRFYQRRSVEALLEAGKRLLVLRELCQFGTEFDQRVELLGFSRRTAYRFMQAASKTAKSANLAALSMQVKNASAFLELVTHDDDVLDGLQEMDDVDRMSASELRKALREIKADQEQMGRMLTEKDAKINALARKASKFRASDWPDEIKKPIAFVSEARREIRVRLGSMAEMCRQAMANTPADEAEREAYTDALRALAEDMRRHIREMRDEFDAMEATFLPTLGSLVDDADESGG